MDITNSMNDFIKSQGLKYEGCIGMEMTKRFNSGRWKRSDYYSDNLKQKRNNRRYFLGNRFGYGEWLRDS